MKPIKAALFASVLVAACSPQGGATAQSPKPAASPAEPAPQTEAVTAQFLVGRWGDNGDCTKDIIFGADATFRSYTGGAGTWVLNGEELTITGQNGAFPVRVRRIDDGALMILNPDGSMGISQRC